MAAPPDQLTALQAFDVLKKTIKEYGEKTAKLKQKRAAEKNLQFLRHDDLVRSIKISFI